MSEQTAYEWLRKILKDAGYDPDLAIYFDEQHNGIAVYTQNRDKRCPSGDEARRFIDEAHAQVAAEETTDKSSTQREWCVMHPQHPDGPHRGPMSEQEARDWVASTIPPGSGRKPFYFVAHRDVGPWKIDDDAFSWTRPSTAPIKEALEGVYGEGDMVTSLADHLADSWLMYQADNLHERRSVEDSVWRTIWDWFPGGDTAQVAAKAVVEAVESDG
jgi:hypothetical protein